MVLSLLNNGESGLDSRTKINNAITAINNSIQGGIMTLTQLGCVGNDFTDNTTIIQNALNGGIKALYVDPGIFRFTADLNFPSTFQYFCGPGTLNGTTHSLVLDGLQQGIVFDGLTFTGATFVLQNTNQTISDVTIRNCVFEDNGFDIIMFDAGSSTSKTFDNIRIHNNVFQNETGGAILASPTIVSNNMSICNNEFIGNGTAFNHTIDLHTSTSTASHNRIVISGNKIIRAGQFGIALGNSDGGSVTNNELLNGVLDGMEVVSSGASGVTDGITITGNTIHSGDGLSVDLGIGLGANDGSTIQNGFIAGNYICKVGNAGIYVYTADASFVKNVVVQGNYVFNCSRHSSNPGITLTQFTGVGGTISDCFVNDNIVVCTDNLMNVGILLTSICSNTHVYNNQIVAPGSTRFGNSTATGTLTDEWLSFTCTTTPSVGAITAQTSNSRYMTIEKTVFVQIDVTITNVGTGAGTTTLSLPLTSTGPFFISGRENGLTGKVIQMQASGILFDYNNAVMAPATGANYTMSGQFQTT